MTTSALQRPVAFGIGQGEWPSYGAKVFQYPLDLTAGATTFDVTGEIMADQIDFVQSVYIDNADSASNMNNAGRLDLTFAVTGQRICVPPQAQGIYSLLILPGAFQVAAKGPAMRYNILFCNMPLAPNVWKTV